jgi:hypothetical protein
MSSSGRRHSPFLATCTLTAVILGCATGTGELEDQGVDRVPAATPAAPDGGTVEAVQCRAPLVVCDGVCLDPSKDPTHCGASGDCRGTQTGRACGVGIQCTQGICGAPCPKGNIVCGAACIDPLADTAHCGAAGDCQGPRAGTPCGAGSTCTAGTCAGACTGNKTFSFVGTPETFVVPTCATKITVEARGAQGGTSPLGSLGGLGALVQGTVPVTPGSTLTVVVGEQPPSAQYANGGGGGSYVATASAALFVAGGGGGGYESFRQGGSSQLLTVAGNGTGGTSYNNGGGGGGFNADGAGLASSGGGSFVGGSRSGSVYPAGNTNCSRGGFGGGGGASQFESFNAGGGGGYIGGNSGNGSSSTGGSSYITPTATITTHSPGIQTGMGKVILIW